MEMWCPDDTGRDSWYWVGPPAWVRACFNSPEWGGGSSPVLTEPPQIVLLLLLLLFACCCSFPRIATKQKKPEKEKKRSYILFACKFSVVPP